MAFHLEPDDQNLALLLERTFDGPLVMLNLLRFRAIADYSASPELAPAEPISGREAYDRYVAHTVPYLEQTGGSLLFLGQGGHYFIGPTDEPWDLAMLVRQTSLDDFFSFANNPGYQAGLGHRTAALIDSRLLPLVDQTPAR